MEMNKENTLKIQYQEPRTDSRLSFRWSSGENEFFDFLSCISHIKWQDLVEIVSSNVTGAVEKN